MILDLLVENESKNNSEHHKDDTDSDHSRVRDRFVVRLDLSASYLEHDSILRIKSINVISSIDCNIACYQRNSWDNCQVREEEAIEIDLMGDSVDVLDNNSSCFIDFKSV